MGLLGQWVGVLLRLAVRPAGILRSMTMSMDNGEDISQCDSVHN